jgi:hypothetical protein
LQKQKKKSGKRSFIRRRALNRRREAQENKTDFFFYTSLIFIQSPPWSWALSLTVANRGLWDANGRRKEEVSSEWIEWIESIESRTRGKITEWRDTEWRERLGVWSAGGGKVQSVWEHKKHNHQSNERRSILETCCRLFDSSRVIVNIICLLPKKCGDGIAACARSSIMVPVPDV